VTLLVSAVLGVIQGLTEFLPVSSTAHLLLAGHALGFNDPAFTVMIQLGSMLAVVWVYREKLTRVLRGLPSSPDARRFAGMVLVAFIPAVIAGGLLSGFITNVLYESPRVIASAFVIGGVVMLLVERFRPAPRVHNADQTPFPKALGIGVSQMLALVPGVSRSGATIVGGMVMGLDRPAAAEFSFFLAIPTMTAAFAKSLLDLRGQLVPERLAEIGVGFVFAFLASLAVIGPFLRFVGRSGFAPFAWYRIAAGIAIFGALAAGWL
jgi:undecaprenyl-diphosphatase